MLPTITTKLDDRIALQLGEAARAVGISRSTIYRFLDNGTLASTRIGGRRLILRDDLEAFARKGRVEK